MGQEILNVRKKKIPEYTFYKISKKLETGHDKLDLKLINLPASTVASKKKKKKKVFVIGIATCIIIIIIFFYGSYLFYCH